MKFNFKTLEYLVIILFFISMFANKPIFYIPLLILMILLPKLKNKINFNFMEGQTIKPDTNKILGKIKGSIGLTVIIIIVIILVIKSIVVIPAGFTGVYHLFGKVKDNEIRLSIDGTYLFKNQITQKYLKN